MSIVLINHIMGVTGSKLTKNKYHSTKGEGITPRIRWTLKIMSYKLRIFNSDNERLVKSQEQEVDINALIVKIFSDCKGIGNMK